MSDIRPIIPEGMGLVGGGLAAVGAYAAMAVIVLVAVLLHPALRAAGRRGCFTIGATGLGIDLNRRCFARR